VGPAFAVQLTAVSTGTGPIGAMHTPASASKWVVVPVQVPLANRFPKMLELEKTDWELPCPPETTEESARHPLLVTVTPVPVAAPTLQLPSMEV